MLKYKLFRKILPGSEIAVLLLYTYQVRGTGKRGTYVRIVEYQVSDQQVSGTLVYTMTRAL